MFKKYISIFVIIFLITACNNSNQSTSKTSPTTDIEVATTFNRNILDNNLKAADAFIYKDSSNLQYFEMVKQQYAKKDEIELAKYKNADIIIDEIKSEGDTASFITFRNSYKPLIKQKMKLIRMNNQWKVDLKYSFSNN